MSDLESAKQESEEKVDTDTRECEESEVKDDQVWHVNLIFLYSSNHYTCSINFIKII